MHEPISRRDMLARVGLGFGTLALTGLLADEGLLHADEAPVAADPAAKARSVIFLFMGGGPSQVDTFDPKPALRKLAGQAVPDSIARGIPKIARSRLSHLFASPYRFDKRGHSGVEVSELFPEIGKCVDHICVLRSCRHDSPIHAPAEYISTTGTQVGDRPSLGAWLNYGLGSPNRNLPGFVVLIVGETGRPTAWQPGFLPSRYQGVVVRKEGIPNLAMPAGIRRDQRRAQLDLLAALNRQHLDRHPGTELEARLQSYELAFRMQAAASEAFDLKRETDRTHALYGLDRKETAETAACCLLARRLVERGVRFVQVRVGGWDAHGDLVKNHAPQALKTDRPIAALLRDLEQRGLLDSTLVVWAGEFGRTPTAENPGARSPGRDHSPSGYCVWLAGGGVRGGQVIGRTDDVGYAAVERPIHPNDLHATILHALGIDQHRLYYRHNNRKELVTVNGGTVVREVFA